MTQITISFHCHTTIANRQYHRHHHLTKSFNWGDIFSMYRTIEKDEEGERERDSHLFSFINMSGVSQSLHISVVHNSLFSFLDHIILARTQYESYHYKSRSSKQIFKFVYEVYPWTKISQLFFLHHIRPFIPGRYTGTHIAFSSFGFFSYSSLFLYHVWMPHFSVSLVFHVPRKKEK